MCRGRYLVRCSPDAPIAITNVRFALDSKGASPSGIVAAPGTELNLLFSLCGFGTKHGRPKVESLITILDEAKRPVRSPIRIVCGDLGSDVTSVNMKYEFTTDHPGSFFFHIEARDLVAEKHKLRCAIAGGAMPATPRIRETSRRASNVRPKNHFAGRKDDNAGVPRAGLTPVMRCTGPDGSGSLLPVFRTLRFQTVKIRTTHPKRAAGLGPQARAASCPLALQARWRDYGPRGPQDQLHLQRGGPANGG